MPSLTFNPFTNKFDYVGSGSGTSYIDGEVDDSSLLPVTLGSPAVGDVYLAKAGSGVWLINRRPAGLYRRTANNGNLDDWTYLSAFPEVQADSRFRIYNATDSTKEVAFSAAGLTTGTTRTLTVPDASGTLQLTGHASAHATTGTDPLSPASIGAQSMFTTVAIGPISADVTLSAYRAAKFDILSFAGSAINVTLPTTGINAGDVAIISSPALSAGTSLVIRRLNIDSSYSTLATITNSVGNNGETFRFYTAGAYSNDWRLDVVPTHTHTASAITDSTTAGRALLTAADVSAQRTALALGSAATKNVGTGSTEVAAGDHSHSGVYATASHTHELADLAATGIAASKVLTSDGDGTASWQDAAGSGEVRSDVSGSYTYTGLAAANTAESTASWTIRRSEFTSAGAYVSTTTATNVKWDDRLTASYS